MPFEGGRLKDLFRPSVLCLLQDSQLSLFICFASCLVAYDCAEVIDIYSFLSGNYAKLSLKCTRWFHEVSNLIHQCVPTPRSARTGFKKPYVGPSQLASNCPS